MVVSYQVSFLSNELLFQYYSQALSFYIIFPFQCSVSFSHLSSPFTLRCNIKISFDSISNLNCIFLFHYGRVLFPIYFLFFFLTWTHMLSAITLITVFIKLFSLQWFFSDVFQDFLDIIICFLVLFSPINMRKVANNIAIFLLLPWLYSIVYWLLSTCYGNISFIVFFQTIYAPPQASYSFTMFFLEHSPLLSPMRLLLSVGKAFSSFPLLLFLFFPNAAVFW